jgi:hypothetical protein
MQVKLPSQITKNEGREIMKFWEVGDERDKGSRRGSWELEK